MENKNDKPVGSLSPEQHSGENGIIANGPMTEGAVGTLINTDQKDAAPVNDTDVVVEALVSVFDQEYSEKEIRRGILLYEERRKTRYTRGHSAEIVGLMDEMREKEQIHSN